MGRVSNKNPLKIKVIADPGVAGRMPRPKATRINVVSSPSDANAFLGTVAPVQVIEETDVANALDNEPINVYVDAGAVAGNLISNAEPIRVYVVSGSLGAAWNLEGTGTWVLAADGTNWTLAN